MTFGAFRARVEQFFEDRDPLELSLIATCLLLVVDPYARGIPILMALAAILWRPLQRSALFWSAVAAVFGWGLYAAWPGLDNHKFLIGYWLLALACSFLATDPGRAAARNARVLIGLTFLFALAQKLWSAEYVSHTYFYVELLRDPRFFPLTQLVSGLSYEQLEQNFVATSALQGYTAVPHPVAFQHADSVLVVARLVTWWTAAIEGAVAAAFLLPRSTWLYRWRDAFLLMFLFTTYILAAVPSFGWILVAMALSQTDPEARSTRLLYGVAFLAVLGFIYPIRLYYWDTPLQ